MSGRQVLMKGNEAIAEGAVAAGCRYFFGYPITPQNEIPEYMSRRLPEVGGVFVQSESEVAAINMVFGASACGVRAMTSSSSPGISLKQEGISYLAGAELPALIVNIQRGGPGLGNISASQGDYFQATKGGGHGDYRMLVYAPSNVQEAYDLVIKAFDKADEYRTPVMVLGDGILGQTMEPLVLRKPKARRFDKGWALTGCEGRAPNVVKSLFMGEGELERMNLLRQKKYDRMRAREVMCEEYMAEDAELAVVAFGTAGRIAKAAVRLARERGIKAGLIRPVTLFPFPDRVVQKAAKTASRFLVVEMNTGQMVEDVRLAVDAARPVGFYGRPGGGVPTPAELLKVFGRELRKI
ncbi:MAG: 3-methyl-2-oxobutanoate dehydrogenase subunit VorB [Nitrospirae bacterium]|nr:3-methyl-2-oxobutanoate dehydrogenase subunit VorB [Nitrospirota bacterium]